MSASKARSLGMPKRSKNVLMYSIGRDRAAMAITSHLSIRGMAQPWGEVVSLVNSGSCAGTQDAHTFLVDA